VINARRTYHCGLNAAGYRDLAKVDEDGYFCIVDRKQDLIIAAGYAYPREVEEVLYEHSAGAEVTVIGLPHNELGEEVVPLWCSSRA